MLRSCTFGAPRVAASTTLLRAWCCLLQPRRLLCIVKLAFVSAGGRHSDQISHQWLGRGEGFPEEKKKMSPTMHPSPSRLHSRLRAPRLWCPTPSQNWLTTPPSSDDAPPALMSALPRIRPLALLSASPPPPPPHILSDIVAELAHHTEKRRDPYPDARGKARLQPGAELLLRSRPGQRGGGRGRCGIAEGGKAVWNDG